MWPVYGRLRLSFAVALLTVPPIPSHALLPWDVAKCHSHVMPKSVACALCWWNWACFCIAPRSRPKNNVFCSTPLSVSAFQEWGVSKIHVPCHTVSCFIRNKAETLVTLHVVSMQLYYKRRYGTLSSIPVDALDLLFILDSKRVIFGEVGDNYRLSGL